MLLFSYTIFLTTPNMTRTTIIAIITAVSHFGVMFLPVVI